MEQILVVEDEQDIRETLQDILELEGYKVLTAKNGREGYNAVMNQNPDLVLCDVNMPELNGFELLEALNKQLSDETMLPFIFLTARIDKDDFNLGMSLGANDYILKPFDHKDILKAIRQHLITPS